MKRQLENKNILITGGAGFIGSHLGDALSNLPIGNYHRLLIQGNYDVTFSKNGYHSKIVNATVLNNQATSIDVELVPININPNSVNEEIYTPINKKKFDLLGRDISLKNKKTIQRQKIGTRGNIVIN